MVCELSAYDKICDFDINDPKCDSLCLAAVDDNYVKLMDCKTAAKERSLIAPKKPLV